MKCSTVFFRAQATGPDLHLRVRLDHLIIYDSELPLEPVEILYNFDDQLEATHLLEIEMMGKLPEHTKIDDQNKIIEDRLIKISDIAFDSVEVDNLFTNLAVYSHNFNGSGDDVESPFYGDMGCNGTVRLSFTSPVYIWLLENM